MPDNNLSSNKQFLAENTLNFYELIKELREKSSWDRIQTHKSIAQYSVEEVYELLDAIESESDQEMEKELGDLLLHIFMHANMAEERGAFNLASVINKIDKRLRERLPDVFDNPETDEKTLMKKWESVKQKDTNKSALDGVPSHAPALLKAERVQTKASRLGFDWEEKEDVWGKVFEEIEELKFALKKNDKENIDEEFGDLLFSLVNVSRFEDIQPEMALNRSIAKFTKRFQFVEKEVKKLNRKMSDFSLEELDEFWNRAKLNL
jgi:MazG family protein